MLLSFSPSIGTMHLSSTTHISSSGSIVSGLLISRRPLMPVSGRRRSQILVASCRDRAGDGKFCGRIVDENMIILRKRIHEMKMVEMNYEAPPGWADWEKKYHDACASHVYEGVGLLQRFMINRRPIVGLGLLVLLGLSLPAAASVLLFCLVGACN